MEAVMLWSYSLLEPAECKLFARLGVFSGSFSLQAVEEICQGNGIHKERILDLMASLVDKSLVGTLPTEPEARFRLHEIVRQYAHRELKDSDQLVYWKDRHLQFFVALAEKAEPKIRGSQQLEWLNRLEVELENLRGALRYANDGSVGFEEKDHYIGFAARLAGAMWMFWFIRGRFSEGRRWAEQVLVSLERMDSTSPVLGKLLYTAASFCFFQGDYFQAGQLSLESLRICRAANDLFGEAISYHHLGIVAMIQGDLMPAHNQLHKGLELAIFLGDAWLLSVLQSDLADLADHEGDQHARLDWNKQSLETGRQVGNKFSILYDLLNLAEIAIESDDTRQAALLAEEALVLSREIDERRGISFALHHLGCIAMREGGYRQAHELLKQSLQVIWVTRDRGSILGYLIDLADNATREGKFEFAVRLLAACEAAKMNFPAGYRFVNQSTYERLVEVIPMHLELGTFTALWTLGRLMNLEQAVGYALKDHPSKIHQ
jgi:tetratricopeptide (TPR) repeat protein